MPSLPRFSVERPVFATMMFLIVVVVGLFGFMRLKIDLLPEIELPTVTVSVDYDGASPEVVENQITQFLEEIIGTVPGVEEMTSVSQEGRSFVRVRFGWGTDVEAASLELQSTLEDEINELPDDIQGPWLRKIDINSFPVVVLGVSSRLEPVELTRLIEEEIRYQLARVPGVSQVDTFGGYFPEVRVEVDPERLQGLGIGLDRVLQAIRDANLDLPSGRIEAGQYEVTLRAPAQYRDLDQIRQTVLMTRDGAAVTIGQIAEVVDTYQKVQRIARINGELGLRVGIRKEAGANTVDVAQGFLREIERINRAYPQMTIFPVLNQGNFIEVSIANVAQSVLWGGLLAVVVLLFFLRNVRSTVIISLAIPISIIATFALMFLGGLTINLMTLGGLALGVGMMVDSSIVVLENIFRRRDEMGEGAREAAVKGAEEVAGAIVASTLTTLVIFLPLVFVRGATGLLFRDLAYVVVFALVCSLLVALSLVPMLASRLIGAKGAQRKELPAAVAGWFRQADGAIRGMERVYLGLLDLAVGHPWKTVAAATGALGFSLLLAPFIGTELLPPSDESEVRVEGEMETGTRVDLIDGLTKQVEAVLQEAIPEARATVVEVSSGGMNIGVSLVPVRERKRSSEEIADAVRELLHNQVPGMEIRVRAPQGQFILNRLLGGGGGINVEVRGYDLDTLAALAEEAGRKIREVPGVVDVRTPQREGVPQEEIRINRPKVADLGLSARDVAAVLRTAIAGSDAGDFHKGGFACRILVQMRDAEKLTIEEVLDLTLTTPEGGLVALRNLVTTEPGRSPEVINRKEKQRIATVWVNRSGRAAGSVAADIQAEIDRIPRPAEFSLEVAGSYEEQQESFLELVAAFGLSLALVYMVLACQYESLRDPLIVMTAAPMAAIGVLVTLAATGTTFNLQSGIGCIMLGGIVVNNSILLVDQAGHLRRAGMDTREAVREAGRRRLRPILMTTLTTMMGLLPLALGIGEGADAQAPLARAVIGGLAASTAVTLVLAPAVYHLTHRKRVVEVPV